MLEKTRDTWIMKPLDEFRIYVASYGRMTTALLVVSVLTGIVAVSMAAIALSQVQHANS